MSKAILKKGLGLRLVALAAVVAAVALVGAVFTQSADAATIDLPAASNSVTAAPGDTVTIVVADAFAQVTITSTASGVDASFAGGSQSIACSDAAVSTCDLDDSDTTAPGRQNTAGSVTVGLKIAEDSGEGHILLSVSGVGSTNTDLTKVITVSKAGQVGSLVIMTDDDADKTVTATGGVSNLTVTVKNASTPPAVMAGQEVIVTTTHGTVGCGVGAGSASAGNSQACAATATGADGIVDVILTGGGVPGQATVTATLGTRTDSATVTLFGPAANLTAEPQQNSVEIGGSVFVVLTATDAAGNPVGDLVIAPVATAEVVGPNDAADDVKVTTEKDSTGTETGDALGVGYSRDLLRSVAQGGNIPACGDDGRGRTASPVTEAFADDNDGTNEKGQCVVYVTAPIGELDDPTDDATRGEHTLNFAVSEEVKASATITVGGPPTTITSDAPARVDALSETTITVSVVDDAGVAVGGVAIRIDQVEGAGLITTGVTSLDTDPDTEGAQPTMTVDGQHAFTYLASRDGTAVFRVSAGSGAGAIVDLIEIAIGEAASEEPEAPAAISMTLRAGGFLYAVTAEGPATTARALFGDAVMIAWKYNADTGAWDASYIPSRSRSNFSINTGDILYVDSPHDQTVGG